MPESHVALAKVAAHRCQYWQTYRALVHLTQEDARRVTSLPALAAFGCELSWLSEDMPLSDDVRTLIIGMRDVGHEVASALESDSSANCLRQLEEASRMLDALRLRVGELGSTLSSWSDIVSAELEEVRQRQRIE